MTKRGWAIAGIAASALLVLAAALIILNNEPDSDEGIATETTLAQVTTTNSDETSTTTTVPGSTTTGQVDSSSTTIGSSPTTVPPTAPPGTLPATPDPDAGEDEDDPVPYQTSIAIGGWDVGVALANLDATDIVLDFVPFNDPPAEGSVYVLVELSGVNTGSSIVQPVFDWQLKAPGFEHTPDGLECGVIPESIYDVGDVQPGDSMNANVCFEVPEEFANEDLLLSLGLFDNSGVERFFALE